MELERLKIFDEHHKQTGVATRSEVHCKGYWHETFHCWFYDREDEEFFLYFQIRSQDKKDYPGLLDITAAGHLLVDETVLDGIREVEEELGIAVLLEELNSVGIIKYECKLNELHDREFCHVYLYEYADIERFALQKEEVAGIVRVRIRDVRALFLENKNEIEVVGFIMEDGERRPYYRMVNQFDFVQHGEDYFRKVINHLVR